MSKACGAGKLRPGRDQRGELKGELGMRGKEQTTRSREGQGSAFSRDPAWKNKIPGAKARDPEKPR